MVGMNLNGVIQGNELRLVAKEILKKAKAQSGEAGSGAAIIKENPFSDLVSGRAEFIPQETKTAKVGFEQNKVNIDGDVKKSVNSLAAIERYGNLAFRTKDEMALDPAPAIEAPLFMASAPDEGKKNPFLLMLMAMFSKDGENAADDPLKVLFEAATSAKK